jgi:curved DNA-binding protein CbpA
VAGGDPADVDLYLLLGVPPDASDEQVTRAYRRRMRAVHPDTRAAGAAGDDRAQVAALQRAHRILRDPAQRERYDAARRARTCPREPAPQPAPQPDPVRIPVRRRSRPVREPEIRVGPVRVEPLPPRPGSR